MIETKRKVAFRYLECGTDGKQRPSVARMERCAPKLNARLERIGD